MPRKYVCREEKSCLVCREPIKVGEQMAAVSLRGTYFRFRHQNCSTKGLGFSRQTAKGWYDLVPRDQFGAGELSLDDGAEGDNDE